MDDVLLLDAFIHYINKNIKLVEVSVTADTVVAHNNFLYKFAKITIDYMKS